MPRQVGSTPHIQFNPIQKKYFRTSLSIGLNRISLATNRNAFLVIHFLINQIQIQFNPIQKVEFNKLNWIDFFVLR